MKLASVVPWGRSLSEYKEMFSLSSSDLEKTILGCGDGPASFNAELNREGGTVVSVDPIYQFDADEIRNRIDEVYPQIVEQVSKNREDYIWKNIPDVESLVKIRMDAMHAFLDDYGSSTNGNRYLNASLPPLPFENKHFGLALCSHYLFLYSEHITQEEHVLSMRELCRVATEVRVYPLVSIVDNQESAHLGPVMSDLKAAGIDISLVDVDYEFQKGATQMLVAKSE